MDPVQYNKDKLMFFGACTPPPGTSAAQKMKNTGLGLTKFVLQSFNFTGVILYIILYARVDVKDAFYGTLEAAAVFPNLYSVGMGLTFANQFRDVFEKIQGIYEKYKYAEAFQPTSTAYVISRKITTFFWTYFAPGYIIYLFASSAMNIIKCYVLNHLTEPMCIELPYEYILPWNQKTSVSGRIKTIVFANIVSDNNFIISSLYLSSFLTVCWQYRAFRAHFGDLLERINGYESKSNVDVRKTLVEAIQFHILIKEIFMDSQRAYNGVLFVNIFGGVVYMSTSLFELELALQHPDAHILIILNLLFVSATNLYCYCYAGMVVTTNCIKFTEILYNVEWYAIPVPLQKYFISMIENAHRPVVYYGYGIASLSLETYGKMLKTVFSYELMFRRFILK